MTPFSCQHLNLVLRMNSYFHYRSVKFPYIEDWVWRFWAGLQLPLPPFLNSCFKLPNEQVNKHSKNDFQSVPQTKSPTQTMMYQPWYCYQPIKKGANFTNFPAPSVQSSPLIKQQLEQSFSGNGHHPHHDDLHQLLSSCLRQLFNLSKK